jgi:hypothetical protein
MNFKLKLKNSNSIDALFERLFQMRINPTPRGSNLHEVIDGTLYSTRVSGTTVGLRAPNNFKSKSTTFQLMNYYVQQLDSAFHLLPP